MEAQLASLRAQLAPAVDALAGLAEAVALDGSGEDHGGSVAVLHRRLVGVVQAVLRAALVAGRVFNARLKDALLGGGQEAVRPAVVAAAAARDLPPLLVVVVATIYNCWIDDDDDDS